ncbi:hypothetical protein [Chroococcidiopsis sp.]|uniref:hypothetical protein n=1 Tax=Chroococcidiopsis sp. TaxID=3088168 RepID=UPI003F32BA64
MVRNNQGLTDTYNRFHDPDENHPDILKLRGTSWLMRSHCPRCLRLDGYFYRMHLPTRL